MKRITLTFFSFSFLLFSVVQYAAPAYANAHLQPPAPPPQIGGVTPPPPPPPPPPAQQLKVYYTVNGQTLGPFNADQLKAKIAAGEVGRQTLVWMEGMAEWQAAATVAAVAPLLTNVPPTPKFDAAAYLVGTWEARYTVSIPGQGQAQVSESMTYRPDGTVTGFGTMVSQSTYGPITVTMSSQGTFTAEAKTQNSFVLTPNIQVTFNSGAGIPNTSTNTTPALLTVVDRNTMAIDAGTRMHRVGN